MRRCLPAAVRVTLGGIFIYASLFKIGDPVEFAGNVAAYRILPYFSSYLVAAVLPWVEFVAGVLLVSGYRVKGGALVIGVLNLVFIAALASALVRGLEIDCGCFKGGSAKGSLWVPLARDLVFFAMTFLVLKWETEKETRRRA